MPHAAILFFCLCFGSAIVAIQLTMPAGPRARVSAVCLFGVNLAGIGLGGTAIASVSDRTIGDEARIGEAMAIVGSLAILMAVLCLWLAPRIVARFETDKDTDARGSAQVASA